MSESKYKDAWKKGFDSGVESQRLSCIYECTKDYDEYESGYQKGRADAIKEVISYLHEYDIIDCNCCTENNRCDRDCWDVIAEQLKN